MLASVCPHDVSLSGGVSCCGVLVPSDSGCVCVGEEGSGGPEGWGGQPRCVCRSFWST